METPLIAHRCARAYGPDSSRQALMRDLVAYLAVLAGPEPAGSYLELRYRLEDPGDGLALGNTARAVRAGGPRAGRQLPRAALPAGGSR
jgi:hypothetical protein